jgi:thermolabile hemolysin
MNQRIKPLVLAGFLSLLLIIPSGVSAYTPSNILSFGDDWTDNGPADGYGIQHYTNGPVWVEYMASHYSVPLLDMAYGGATTGIDDPAAGQSAALGLQWQVSTYLNNVSSIVPSNTLVTVWAGYNDFLNHRAPDEAASNVATTLTNLAKAGGQYFLIPNLPDLASTPQFLGTTFQGEAKLWSQAFNAYLALDLQTVELAYPTDQFYTPDFYNLINGPYGVMANSTVYGFTDVNTSGNQHPPPGFMFWDTIHYTTQTHLLLADDAEAAIATGVPEPATMLLLGLGLIGVAGIRRKFRS